MSILISLLIGLVFGCGLIVSGMSNPAKVLAFLDLAGDWDPSLALVMAGAIAVGLPAFSVARRRQNSLRGKPLQMPTARQIDRRLLAGSALFGIGWGLAGICPGPALVLLGSGAVQGAVFVLAMLAGMAVFTAFERLSQAREGRSDRGQ
ncbi:YeeE/YedE family protein [Accumulibacter sp.]|uniref:YeeE/YedE family protein n=1 Tax=Accumulibacter sp. TaxID=2053492 RepID=UPI0025F62A8A|nr:YeeE/YedE family protein [Accumulibacter sp.]MCM8613014.1 YeeE/YedE family protein [Accumulibacter sp.]MCM8637063.1 YeeE/YedE family protein [Accumulibacter sp.]MCM8640658.1 YeeE/YedE family protein [Accumulibacter sp.]